jgi:hypothetical protein
MLFKIKKIIFIFEVSQPIQLFSHEVVFIISGNIMLFHLIFFKNMKEDVNEPPLILT